MDPSSFFLGALLVAAKGLAVGAIGFGIAWWHARNRIRQLEAQHHFDPQPLYDRMDRLEGTLDSVVGSLERLAAGQGEIQRRLAPPGPGKEGTR